MGCRRGVAIPLARCGAHLVGPFGRVESVASARAMPGMRAAAVSPRRNGSQPVSRFLGDANVRVSQGPAETSASYKDGRIHRQIGRRQSYYPCFRLALVVVAPRTLVGVSGDPGGCLPRRGHGAAWLGDRAVRATHAEYQPHQGCPG